MHRPAIRRSLGLELLLAPALLGLALVSSGAPARSAPAQAQPASYRLIDTWSARAWQPEAGRYRDAVDISALPDGRLVLLDHRFVEPIHYPALHVVAPDGRAEGLLRWTSGDQRLVPDRLDVGADGSLYLLWTSAGGRRQDSARLERWTQAGQRLWSWPFDEAYVDVAVRDDGRVYLARSAASSTLGPAAVDVYDPSGQRLASLQPPEMDTPIRLDVDGDGSLYVLQEVPPPPEPREPGGPREPPGPSAPRADPVPGVLVFAPDHLLRELVPFDFGIDVAAGPAGVFVARYGQAFALGEETPIHALAGAGWTGQLALEAPAGGGLYGSLSHCEFEGMIRFERPEARPAVAGLFGALDHPAREGPVWPLRIAAEREAAVLQGRFGPSPAEDLRPSDYLRAPSEPQVVQIWNDEGSLQDQIGVCGGAGPSGEILDLDLDAGRGYLASGSCVERRSGPGFADWHRCLDGIWGGEASTRIAALAADAGRIAVLDAGGGVAILDDAGRLSGQWSLAPDLGAPSSTYVDLDLSGSRLALADAGRSRVELRELDGRLAGGFDLPDRPQSLSFGPDGRILVLGQGGWGLAYAPAGELLAVWRLPRPDMPLRDLAVLDDGRVLVSFARAGGSQGWSPIEEAGVWVFAPRTEPPSALPPGPEACAARPDKRAAPERIPLGQSVTVRLTIEGDCPPLAAPLRLMLVVDTSRSMGWGYALDRAKALVVDLLGELDPRRVEVGLVTFDDVEALAEPPGRDLLGLARRVSLLRARGDTRMAGAIDLARRQLPAPGLPEGTRRAILVVTDANPSDATLGALQAAVDEGIALSAVVLEDGQPADPAFLEALDRAGGRLFASPAEWDLPELARTLLAADPVPGLFEQVEIVDDIPGNMRYLPGSARPAAAFDPAAMRLTWRLGAVAAASGLELSYRLQPMEVGTWPTNRHAAARYRDALGRDGELLFPVPTVEVYQPERWPLYLPLVSRGTCLKPERPVDLALVIDSSSSMAEPANGAEPGGPSKLDAAREAARGFLRLLDLPSDRAAVLAFDGQVHREIGLSAELGALEAALDRLVTGQGTRIDLGLSEARRLLGAEARGGAQPVVVLLTDGLQEGGDRARVLAAAAELEQAGVRIYTIGLGEGVDAELLRAAASSPDRYFASPSTDDLARIYARISLRLACE